MQDYTNNIILKNYLLYIILIIKLNFYHQYNIKKIILSYIYILKILNIEYSK